MSSTEGRRKLFRSLEAKSLRKRSMLTKFADKLTTISGSPAFLVTNAGLFVIWIVINLGIIPGIPAFDPFPFGLLTMAVSLEAIFLSIFVLVSQNRSAYIGTIRDEVELHVNLTAEREITKILQILAEMRKKMGIHEKDAELEQMLNDIDEQRIEQNIVGQIERADSGFRSEIVEGFTGVFDDIIKKQSK